MPLDITTSHMLAMTPWAIGGIVVGGLVLRIIVLFLFQYIGLYVQAWISGAPVRFVDLVMMRFRKVRPRVIVENRITAKKAGIDLSTALLESHYLAGGRVTNVVRSLIAADKAKIDLSWPVATAIDLAGRDILEAVRTSVNPKVIDCPSPESGKTTIDAVAKDGIKLKARARVTVRTNIAQLVGGATEETIIARVGEGIVSTIGSAANHLAVLENPDNISRVVLEKGLDAGTAYEILSIDIADIDVGDNIGARLQADQAGRRHQAIPGQGRTAKSHGGRPGSGIQGRGAEEPRAVISRGSRDSKGHGRCLPWRQHGHHGLLPHEERHGGYGYEVVDCRRRGFRFIGPHDQRVEPERLGTRPRDHESAVHPGWRQHLRTR